MQEPILGQRVLSRLVRNLGGEEQAAERVWLLAVDALMVELARVPPQRS